MSADTLAETIAAAITQDMAPGVGPAGTEHPPLADRIAAAIHANYHTIPVTETEPINVEYQVPDMLALDAAALPQVHRQQFVQLAAAAAGNGYLVISGTYTVIQLPILPDTPPGVTRFRLTALAWRQPQNIPTQETPTS